MSVYKPMVGALWRTLEHYGVDPSLAIRPDLYGPGDAPEGGRVTFEAWNRAQATAAELVGDPAFGLRNAEHMHPSHLGALGYAWLASSSLATGMSRFRRFQRMVNQQLQMRIEADDVSLTVNVGVAATPLLPEVLADFQIGSLFRFCRLNFGERLLPLRVMLRRPVPDKNIVWDEFFGVPVGFGQPANSISFRKEDVYKKLTVSDRNLVRVHENVIERYLAQLDRKQIAGRARAIIVDQLPSGTPVADQVATALNMNTRTLHRKLANERVSFRSLLTEVRKELAGRYVVDPSYDFTEIAFLLGYSDSSSFSRAFRSWFGKSPSEARAESQ